MAVTKDAAHQLLRDLADAEERAYQWAATYQAPESPARRSQLFDHPDSAYQQAVAAIDARKQQMGPQLLAVYDTAKGFRDQINDLKYGEEAYYQSLDPDSDYPTDNDLRDYDGQIAVVMAHRSDYLAQALTPELLRSIPDPA